MKETDRGFVMPCLALNEKYPDEKEKSSLVSMDRFIDSEYYSLRTKITCAIWLEKKGEISRRMLARFLR